MIAANEHQLIGISVISFWEVAMLIQRRRLAVTIPALDWIEAALTHPAVSALNLTPKISEIPPKTTPRYAIVPGSRQVGSA
jgi:PIN domain nuclease of toxin-antitoxin system